MALWVMVSRALSLLLLPGTPLNRFPAGAAMHGPRGQHCHPRFTLARTPCTISRGWPHTVGTLWAGPTQSHTEWPSAGERRRVPWVRVCPGSSGEDALRGGAPSLGGQVHRTEADAFTWLCVPQGEFPGGEFVVRTPEWEEEELPRHQPSVSPGDGASGPRASVL